MLKNGLKDEQCCQIADVPKIVSSYRWQYSLFRICSKERLWDHVSKVSCFGYDPKNCPPPLWIIWIKNLFFDFSKEMQH